MSSLKLPNEMDLLELVMWIGVDMADAREDAIEYAKEYGGTDGEYEHGVTLTVGWTPSTGEWGYQTGDNSFTGGAYGHPVWAVVYVTDAEMDRDEAGDVVDEILEQLTNQSIDGVDHD